MISSPGVGSGLNVNSIVSQLMALERQPLDRLNAKKADFEAQLSAYGRLKSALSDFHTAMDDLSSPSDFKLFNATSGNEDVFTASANSDAAKGSYGIEVTQLAEAHKMGSVVFGDADTTTVGNAGDQLQITIDGESFSVEIGAKTLTEVRDAINAASDNVGVTASIVQEDNTSFYLTLTSQETGTANAMSLAFTDSGGGSISDPLTMAATNAALNATLVVDGTYNISRASNTITDAIDGITLELQSADVGTRHELDIERDIEGITEQAQAFVDAYNNLRSTIQTLRGNELEADNTLLNMERQIRNELNTAPTGLSGTFSYLVEIGVSVDVDGNMSLDSDEFESALASDFNGVTQLFGNDDQGFAFRLEALADSLLESDGLVDARTDGINDSIESIGSRIDNKEQRMEQVEQRYLKQFSGLDGLVARLNTTGSFLNQQLATLPFIALG